MADWTLKAGDTAIAISDELSYDDGSPVDLTGATVSFVVRGHASRTPFALTGRVIVDNAATGALHFEPSAQDTATTGPGLFAAGWSVAFSDSRVMSFPTVGNLWLSVEDNPANPSAPTLVGLPDLKDYLNIRSDDRTHDAKLIRFIHRVRPLIEAMTGPIIPTVYEEWHDGGQPHIGLRRRPSSGYGTSPVLTLVGCEEYRGPIKYPLDIVANPAQGSIYSCMLDSTGRVVRRTVGGGVIAFPPAPQSVHVVYEAGQAVVPPNIYEATLELIRVNYQTTQQVGRGRRTVADEPEPSGPHLGFFMPGRVRELLSPNRRAPSIA